MKTYIKSSFFMVLLMAIFTVGMNSANAKNTKTKNISTVKSEQSAVSAQEPGCRFVTVIESDGSTHIGLECGGTVVVVAESSS